MSNMKIGTILLVFLLAAMAIVPCVSAGDDTAIYFSSEQLVEESRMMSVDVSKIPVTPLKINDDVEKVTVKQGLTSESGKDISAL